VSLVDGWIVELEARWPGVKVVEPKAPFVPGAEGADLLLAAACLANDPRALGYLDALLINEVRRAVAPLDTTNALVDEVTQLVRERLLLPPARLCDYSGQGSLASWIRAVAVRIALNAKRPGAREDPVSSVPDGVIAGADPELALLRSRYREAFRTAFTEAVGGLTPRERTIMRLTSLDGLTCAQVGQMYGKDASTISRWLAASRAVLLEKTRLLLSTQLALSPSGLDSLMRLADSELELNISGLLESRHG
jgi:RNA polymerase sigma-70 factor, ECF subfamily